MKFIRYHQCLALVLLIGFLRPLYSQQDSSKSSIPSSFTLPNKQMLSYMTVLKPIDKSLIYSTTGWVTYTQIILKSGNDREQIIYQAPSAPVADVASYSQSRKNPPIVARMDKDRLEIMRQSNGWFELLRFRRKDANWVLSGMINERDFDDGLSGGPIICTGAELIEWSKIQLNMSNGSKRILTIDEEGIIRENGKVHEYTNLIRPDNEPQEQCYKNSYRESLAEYFEPRDANGVPLSYIDLITRDKAAKSASKSSAPVSNGTVEKNHIEDKKSRKHGPETAAPIKLPQLGSIWSPMLYGIVAIACVGSLLVYFLRRK